MSLIMSFNIKGEFDLRMITIDNTLEAQRNYKSLCGNFHYIVTIEEIKDLLNGKQLAFDNGEYCSFISMSEPK